ncbi:MAG: hypothetical protein M3Y49_10120 [Actinomycetota bacterium]|nr:hypothetical protein [Actinomycetota bacterium]
MPSVHPEGPMMRVSVAPGVRVGPNREAVLPIEGTLPASRRRCAVGRLVNQIAATGVHAAGK